jgi:hypothetical protein
MICLNCREAAGYNKAASESEDAPLVNAELLKLSVAWHDKCESVSCVCQHRTGNANTIK